MSLLGVKVHQPYVGVSHIKVECYLWNMFGFGSLILTMDFSPLGVIACLIEVSQIFYTHYS